jgi:hypothetical protein
MQRPLFLTTILQQKFCPAIERSRSPYSRLQSDPRAPAWSFLKAIRLDHAGSPVRYIWHGGYFIRWSKHYRPQVDRNVSLCRDTAPAMPVMTLQILFTPANNALGRLQITTNMFGAVLCPSHYSHNLPHWPGLIMPSRC